tara:strand:- start:970 stop:1431 length:462 start_codon:yes stop_codon:yes gene_type:complete
VIISEDILTTNSPNNLEFLSQVAEEVTPEEYGELHKLETTMLHMMEQEGGVGLAAPQVGLSKRVFIMQPTNGFTLFMANPVITKSSVMRMKFKEGCLSIPNKQVTTNRSRQVTIDYIDSFGKEQTIRLGGRDAIVAQHEIDHLDGILMTKYKR